jgi:hypothetical protein
VQVELDAGVICGPLPVYLEQGAVGAAPKWSAAFAKGCHGEVRDGATFGRGLPFAFWGQPALWQEFLVAREESPSWYYGDHAFFGRGRFYRCVRNAMQFTGRSGNDDPARFRRFNITVRDWRRTGRHILLCPNSEVFFGLHGLEQGQWVRETTAVLRRYSDRPVRVRWKSDTAQLPLEDDLRDCWAVVVFVSNAAVGAALAGVPVFCTAECAGLTMGSGDLSQIEAPAVPDGRERWAARLANHQWTLDEMRAGALWNAIGE